MLGKLIRIERHIELYDTNDSGPVLEAYEIEFSPIEVSDFIEYRDDDVNYYDGYVLDEQQLGKILELTKTELTPDFTKFRYVLTATGIYE
ncbi:MAG: hypothetical protein H6551_12115 [Chitinophagales bacterium]|nr:hypothetical protein [Chitinophagaceae bacterium]MCB9065874.1 hypothetical protein [Chitinophagales bacterium]